MTELAARPQSADQRGEWFAAGGTDHRGRVRLSFSEPEEDDLREGVSRLATAYRALV